MTRVLVTGPTGFIGTVLCETLTAAGYSVRGALRTDRPVPSGVAEKVVVGDIGSATDWAAALEGVDSIVHTAARAHVLHDDVVSSNSYTEPNELGTKCLAESAARARIRRFVYLSSIKVNGEETNRGAFTALDLPCPQDAYAVSKWHAERHVLQIAAQSEMQAAIVRAPLVYGPGVRANFLRLMMLVDRQWPLPLAAVHNTRSLVNIWNLCDLLLLVLKHPSAQGSTWMASDSEDLSTADLVRRIGVAMDRRVRLFPVPVGALRFLAALLGRGTEMARLTDSLVVDVTQTHAMLGWAAPVTVDEALVRTAKWYRNRDQVRAI